MSGPPGHEERRPRGGEDGAQSLNPGEDFDAPSLVAARVNGEESGAGLSPSELEGNAGFILWQADCIVGLESMAQHAVRSLSTDQLRAIRWIGLLDEGWRRMVAELERRGETL